MNLLGILLKALLNKNTLSALAKKTGLTPAKLKKLLPLALPLLLKYLTSNAASQNGALSLLGALGQHNTAKALPVQIAEADPEDGSKILGHIFGQCAQPEIETLAEQSGLSGKEVNTALDSIAPVLLSSLNTAAASAKKKKKVDLSDGLDLSEAMTLLSGNSGGGLLSNLFGGGLFGGGRPDEKDDGLNGNALLQTLLQLM
ncbi:MAG: DUF937 domain-containing protein [Clostridia bacterium]